MAKSLPTREQLDAAMQTLYTEMGHLFAYWIWWTRAKPLLLKDEQFGENPTFLKFMQNSAVTTSLLALRKLNEFFKCRPPENNERDDDLRAYDYGFSNTGMVLKPEDFQELHKRIAHITYREVDAGKVSYEIYYGVGLIMPKCLEFLEHVRTTLYRDMVEKQKEVQRFQMALSGMRRKWEDEKRKADKAPN